MPGPVEPEQTVADPRVVLGVGFTPSPTLQADAAALRTPPTGASASAAPSTTVGPQGNPVEGGAVPCVN